MKKLTQNLRWLVTLLTMIVSIGAWAEEVTYTITSTSTVSTSGSAPTGSSATYRSTYTSINQLTSGKYMTLTLSGYSGCTISNLTLSMKSNKSDGAGKLSYSTDGGTTYTYLVGSSSAGVAFNKNDWYGSFTTDYVNISKDVHLVASSSDLVIKIEATANSLYCQSFTITYVNSTTVATPTITPNGGSISTTNDISITCGTPNASIYYTTDGSTPTANSTEYSGPFRLSSNATVKAIAVKDGMTNSNVTTASFTVTEPPIVTTFTHYSGNLTEGDYIIYYNGKAMNTTIESNRLQYEEVAPSNNIITTDNSSIIWHIAPSGDYWTIYNANEGKYAASTGTKNQAKLLENGTDNKSLWTIIVDDVDNNTYNFENKYNLANNVNAYLRNNGTYGFACYAATTGGYLSLYKKVANVATPTFSKEAGEFTEPFNLTITCTTEGAAIYYTTDGSTPSAPNGTLYENVITISATTTVKAIAIKDGESSNIVSATYEKVLPSAGLEYSASSAEVTFKETPYTLPTLSNPNTVAVTYSSSEEAVATVNPTTGEVTICGAGTTIITATFAGNDDYIAGSASYTLKVNPMNSTEIDLVNNESVTFTNNSWTSVSGSYPSVEAENQFIGSDGTSTTWSYKKVLKSNNELQFKASEGQLTSPKVNCPDGYGYKVSIIFTSGSSNPSGSLVVTASTEENKSIAAPSSGVDALLSLDVCGWSNVTISNDCSNALYVTEIKFERIQVQTVDVIISDKAKIDNEYYATYSNSVKALHFGVVKGLKAYIVETAEKESSAITLSEVTKVPANTGLLICGTTPKTYKVPVIPSTSANEILGNMLYPSTGMTGDGKSVFILANGNMGLGFYIVKNGSSLNPNQAYLKINNGTSSEIKTFFSLGGDYVNDINHIETEILSDNIGAYNLNGQRVTSPVKGGLYIMNGKKVLIK